MKLLFFVNFVLRKNEMIKRLLTVGGQTREREREGNRERKRKKEGRNVNESRDRFLKVIKISLRSRST